MEPSIDNFTGSWKVLHCHNCDLVSKDDLVSIALAQAGDPACLLEWSKQQPSSIIGIHSPLTYRNGELHADSTSIEIDGNTVADPVAVRARLILEVSFSLVEVGEGDLGTFTAQAQPPTEMPVHRKPPGWRRWLRRLVRWLDGSAAPR